MDAEPFASFALVTPPRGRKVGRSSAIENPHSWENRGGRSTPVGFFVLVFKRPRTVLTLRMELYEDQDVRITNSNLPLKFPNLILMGSRWTSESARNPMSPRSLHTSVMINFIRLNCNLTARQRQPRLSASRETDPAFISQSLHRILHKGVSAKRFSPSSCSSKFHIVSIASCKPVPNA